jgi:hypothetical protein
VSETESSTLEARSRWAARPARAGLVRVLAFLLPIAASIACVDLVSRVVPAPTGSLPLYLGWWILISGVATVVLIAVERVARQLLPLAALFKLSLVFPDAAPSRFQVAMTTSTVADLERRIVGTADPGEDVAPTPTEQAEALLALVRSLDKHDRLTRGHSERVRAYSQLIAQELHLTPDERDHLNWAALLHDVGKLRVPTEILTKPGRPTDAEWQVLRKHTEFGEEMVEPLRGWLGPALDAVGQHHERWDGKGYPHGLEEEQISLYGRIVAVADTYDVITSTRSYKSSQTAVDGRDELAKCAGAQFDPKVVRAFMNISLGRLRLVMGPLSWLAHAPILGRIPFNPAIGTVASSFGTVAAAVSSGVVTTPAVPLTPRPVAAPAALVSAPALTGTTRENTALRVMLPTRLQQGLRSLAIDSVPLRGSATVVDGAIRYVPPRGFDGTVRIGYRVCWNDRGCGLGTLVVTVLPAPEPKPPATHAPKKPHAPAAPAPKPSIGPISADTPAETPPPPSPPADTPAPAAVPPKTAPAGENHDPVALADTFSLPEGGSALVSVLANDHDADGDTLTLRSLGTAAHGIAARDGDRLRYTAPAGWSGPVAIEYVAADGHGGTDTGTVTVHVLDVNAPPSFTAGADQTVDEDAGPQTVAGWAAAIAAGPATEGGQHVAFTAATSDGTLFSRPPAVSADGTLSYTPAANAGGTAHVRVTARDDGGREYGGDDVSAAHDLTITIRPVNDAPSFTKGADQSVAEDAGVQTVAGWATGIATGPANESGQAVSFLASASNTALFSAGPAVAANGTLTYTPAPNANGTATVTVRAHDDGGTANGGVDTSPAATFTIAVTPVNDPPMAADDTAQTAEDGSGVTFDVLANDTDPDTGDTLTVASFDASGIANGTLTHGAGGSFTYVPDAGYHGTETLTYELHDTGGGVDTATVTITVTAVPHAPLPADDGYTTPQDTPLTVASPGVLDNDGDQDGDALTVQTTPVSLPANGSVAVSADGSFTYTPDAGFTGTDAFTYRVVDGTGRDATATVTIAVSSTATLSSRLYLQTSGPSSDLWDLAASLPGATSTLADLDGDGKPGMTIRKSSGQESETDPKKSQTWTYTAPADIDLDGPLTLELWSGTAGFLSGLHDGKLYTYVYDCTAGGASCTTIASNTLYRNPWSQLLNSWTFRSLTVGAVSRTIPAGHELRIRLLFQFRDLWVMSNASYPSSVVLTIH